MAETSEQIKRHIANLTEFETKFGEFVAVLNHEVVASERRWSKEEMASANARFRPWLLRRTEP